jgi:hypothetical protein
MVGHDIGNPFQNYPSPCPFFNATRLIKNDLRRAAANRTKADDAYLNVSHIKTLAVLVKIDGLVIKPNNAFGLRNFNWLQAEYPLESVCYDSNKIQPGKMCNCNWQRQAQVRPISKR